MNFIFVDPGIVGAALGLAPAIVFVRLALRGRAKTLSAGAPPAREFAGAVTTLLSKGLRWGGKRCRHSKLIRRYRPPSGLPAYFSVGAFVDTERNWSR